jgi:hypothetical protein
MDFRQLCHRGGDGGMVDDTEADVKCVRNLQISIAIDQ